jgi:hypothetical protein
MTERKWLRCKDSELLLDYLRSKYGLDFLKQRKTRLFFCACCRRFWHTFSEDDVKRALELTEMYADKLLKRKELVAQLRSIKAGVSLDDDSNESPVEFAVFSLARGGRVNTSWVFSLLLNGGRTAWLG